MLVLPADHVIDNQEAFKEAVTRAASLVQGGGLATFGIVPKAPETGYGYIRRGAALAALPKAATRSSASSKSRTWPPPKPSLPTAAITGTAACSCSAAEQYLTELATFAPDIAGAAETGGVTPATATSISAASTKPPSRAARPIRSTTPSWNAPRMRSWCRPISAGATSAPGRRCGKCSSTTRTATPQRGDVYLDGVKNSLVRAESRIVAVVGLEDVVVVETNDAVLVAHKSQVQRVKQVVDHLKSKERTEHLHHTKVYRPWGHYEGIDAGDRFQVKRITVKPGEKLSLQMHHHRAEHWVVVSGTARVTCGEKVSLLSENESTYIPIGMNHRLENPGKLPLHIIEVQSGSYLGEDDIVRFEDIYKRS